MVQSLANISHIFYQISTHQKKNTLKLSIQRPYLAYLTTAHQNNLLVYNGKFKSKVPK